jgi:hypothetical protein
MKRQLWKVGAFLAALLGTSIAVGQSNQDETVADIPFTFTVADHSFPPGRYTVTPVNQTLLRIFNSHNQGTVVLAHTTEGVAPEETGRMVFHRYGGAYFLSEVWDPASRTGHKLTESRIEADLTRKQTAMEFAVLKIRQ